MELTIDDTIDNIGKGLLGLTIGCARCHDHKFDPIPSKDYYALYGIFNSTRYPFPGSENIKRPNNFVALETKEQTEKKLGPYKDKIAEFDDAIKKIEADRKAAQKEGKTGDASQSGGGGKTVTEFRKLLADAERNREKFIDTLPKVEMAYAVAEATPGMRRCIFAATRARRARSYRGIFSACWEANR